MTAHTVDAATKAGLDARLTDGIDRVEVEAILAAARPHIAAEALADLRERLDATLRRLTAEAARPGADPAETYRLASMAEGVRVALGHLDDTTRSR